MNQKKKLETILFSMVGVGVLFLTLIAFNWVASGFKVRLDWTEDNRYTLSEGTRSILSKLDTPVEIRFYCTRDDNSMPVELKNYARQVEDLLAEYEQYGEGNIVIKKLDPKPATDAEDSAALDGIQGRSVDLVDQIYFGMAFQCVENKFAIPFISPQRANQLEYDISRAISEVFNSEKPVMGVMSSLPVMGQAPNPMMMQMGQMQGQDPWILISEFERDFEVEEVPVDTTSIPENIDLLMVIHPKQLSDATLYALDQFVLRGGKMVAFMDPLSLVDSQMNNDGNPMSRFQNSANSASNMEKLLSAWGIEFNSESVLADMEYLMRLMRGGREETSPSFLRINTTGINPDDITTSELDDIWLPFAGVFSGTPAEGLEQTILLHSSEKSQLVEKFMAEFSSDQVMKDFVASDKEHPIAMRLAGKFKTAFPDGKPDSDPAAEDGSEAENESTSAASHLTESQKETAVILIGDVDFVADQFSVRVQRIPMINQQIMSMLNGNLILAQNFAEQMAGDSDLIKVRSRSVQNRPFTEVNKRREAAEARYRSKLKELEQDLADTQSRLRELQQTSGDENQRFIRSPEQIAEIEKFREKEREVRLELREEQKNLRSEIESLENGLKLYNIAGMPLLVIAVGIVLAVIKRKKVAAR